MDYTGLKSFVVGKLQAELPNYLHYHNVDHTLDVIRQAKDLANNIGVNEMDLTLLKTAALLHDIGYIWDGGNHEKVSAKFAQEKLANWGYSKSDAQQIQEMIIATRIPQTPKSKLAEILCDADLSYLGTDQFISKGNDLFYEFEKRGIIENKREWDERQVEFLRKHRYHTAYAKEHWEPIKSKNLNALIKRIS